MTNNIALGTRLFVTLVLLVLLHLAGLIPLPGVVLKDYVPKLNGHSGLSVISLGLNPFLLGFVAVELLSFVIPLGRRLRRTGIIGRRRLNSYAVSAGVVFALLQAVSISAVLRSSDRIALVNNSISSFLTCVMTLVGGAAFMFVIGKLLSRWGIANGFCVVLSLASLQSLAQSFGSDSRTDPRSSLPWEFVLILAAIGLLVWTFGRRPHAESGNAEQESVALLTLPAFPQGVVPLNWAYAIFNLLFTFRMMQVPSPSLDRSFIGLLSIAVLIAVFSFITSYFFFAPERLARNLPPGVLPPKGEAVSRRLLLQTTALWVVLGTAFPAGEWFFNFHFPAFALPELVVLVALGFDLVAEWRFLQRHSGGVTCIIELDNVYGASYLQGLLAKNGCDALIRAFHYRSLFFFFGPIFKMELMVPVAESDRAWDLIQPEKIEVV